MVFIPYGTTQIVTFTGSVVKLVECESCKGVEFPTKSGHGVKGYWDCSYSAGETYPSDE